MRAKMPRAERAKQFMPFAALEGLEALMCEKNLPVSERIFLGEDAQRELDQKLHALSRGSEVLLTVYVLREYIPLYGRVKKIDDMARCLILEDRSIAIDDLLDLQIL